MQRMKSSRLAILYLSAGLSGLFGCSKSDTTLALTVSTSSGVKFVSKLHVVVHQGNQAPVMVDVTMPHSKKMVIEGAAGAMEDVFDSGFYRILLPESWSDGDATVDVEAYDASGQSYLHPEPVHFALEDEKTTAAFVTLKLPVTPPPPGGGGGSGGGGAGGVATGGGGAGGAAAGSTAEGGAATGGAAAGGEPAGGGNGGASAGTGG
jgi:hypothetical protein